MNDTVNIKPLLPAQIGSTQLDATARAFARITSEDSSWQRSNSVLGSLSPTTLRIAHQPRTTKSPIQRTLCACDQVLTRLDALSNPIGTNKFKVALQADIPEGVSLAEFRAAAMILFGFLLENNGANLDAIYGREY